MNYFKAMTPYRKWKLIASAALLAVAVVALSAAGFTKRQVPYSAGPLSNAHAVFTNKCNVCHVSVIKGVKTVGFKNNVTDEACLNCHEAPAHQSNQLFTPTCGSCHVEHKGISRLVHVTDAQCTQCHFDLRTTGGKSRYVTEITGFNRAHPEFAVLRKPHSDPGTIALNHAVHMSDHIVGPNGHNVRLECTDCHRPWEEANGPWKYSSGHVAPMAAPAPYPGAIYDPTSGRELMAPITYQKHCVACHALQFDARFSDSVPHDKPEIVRAFLVQRFKEYIAKNPGAIHQPEPGSVRARMVPAATSFAPEPLARNAEEWVGLRVAAAEKLLWRKTCKECHQFDYPTGAAATPNALPTVRPSNITVRWLPNSIFSHQAHRAVDCTGCHTQALTSQQTADVLVPGIETCRFCHNGPPTRAGRAENGCFLCHQYHDWSKRHGFKGGYTIPQLIGQIQLPKFLQPADPVSAHN